MYICVNGSVMLWPQCLHDWIWYFSRGCRQCWRSLGMRDHRAFWPRGCMFSSLVWVQRSGPSHPWLFLKVHCVTNRSRQPPTHKLENDNPRDSCPSLECAVKMEGFYFHCTLRGSRDCFRPKCGRLSSRGHVRFMSISQSESVPLWTKTRRHYAAICW